MKNKDLLSKIKDVLEKHRGPQNAISGKNIAKMFGLKEEDTHVEPRKYVWETIKKYKLPVAGGGKGYYWITSQNELDAYCKTMESRADKIIKRKEAITKYFKEYEKNKLK